MGTSSKSSKVWLIAGLLLFLLLLVGAVSVRMFFSSRTIPVPPGLQNSRTIALAMAQFADDHSGHFPNGASSTEVFQKLIDGKYVSDPAIFYLETPGKTKADSIHLKPENVAWDVTVPLDRSSPDDVPLVFCTGYRIEYKPGGRAVPLPDKARPSFSDRGVAVTYHSISSVFVRAGIAPDGTVANFIPADATLDATDYTQLTPDGPLPKK